MIGSGEIVADQSPVSKAKDTTTLLTNQNTRLGLCSTIALSECVGVRERLDGRSELLRRQQIQVLDVIGILRVGLCATRRLRNSR